MMNAREIAVPPEDQIASERAMFPG